MLGHSHHPQTDGSIAQESRMMNPRLALAVSWKDPGVKRTQEMLVLGNEPG
jgi:hypothetical protein